MLGSIFFGWWLAVNKFACELATFSDIRSMRKSYKSFSKGKTNDFLSFNKLNSHYVWPSLLNSFLAKSSFPV